MKFSNQITFVLFMFNEEARVERAVRNFLPYGRVLVVDNYSTDRTVEIAKSLGADVLQHQNPGWVEDEHTASVVNSTVKTPWIYWGFADEFVDKETMNELLAAIDSNQYSIVNIARKNYYYGEFCQQASAAITNRVFLKGAIDFTGNEIHNFGRPTVSASKIKYLNSSQFFVHHFISNTAKSYLHSMDRYTDIEPKTSPPNTASQMLIRMAKTFINNYIVRGGYKAGLPGLYMVIQSIYYEVLVNMKRYEAANCLNSKMIEDKNNIIRDNLLADLNRRGN